MREIVYIALRFAVAFPVCLYVYASAYVALSCYYNWDNFCIVLIVMAPILLMFGPLAHNAEDPPNHYPSILIAALVVVLIWTMLSFVRKRRRERETSSR